MKNKLETLKHLSENGYKHDDVRKIAGFLLGLHITKKDEEVNYKEGLGTFDDFYDWFHGKPKKNKFFDIAYNLDYLLGFTEAEGQIPKNIEERTRENIQFLMENKEYLQECMETREKVDTFMEDINEVMDGLNESLKSLFGK